MTLIINNLMVIKYIQTSFSVSTSTAASSWLDISLFHWPICMVRTKPPLPADEQQETLDSYLLTNKIMLWKTCKMMVFRGFDTTSLRFLFFKFQPPWPCVLPQRYFGFFLVRPPALCTATHWSTTHIHTKRLLTSLHPIACGCCPLFENVMFMMISIQIHWNSVAWHCITAKCIAE